MKTASFTAENGLKKKPNVTTGQKAYFLVVDSDTYNPVVKKHFATRAAAERESEKHENSHVLGFGESAENPSTNLDLILSRVTNRNEVTLKLDRQLSRDEIKRVEREANKKGIHASYDGHNFLFRKLG